MLGELEVVQAILVAQPEALHASGPHGISLLQHARMGGEESKRVYDYLAILS